MGASNNGRCPYLHDALLANSKAVLRGSGRSAGVDGRRSAFNRNRPRGRRGCCRFLRRLAALLWRPAVPLRSVVSEQLPERAEAERERVLPAWARPVAEVAGLREVVSCLRHRHRRPVHPGTEDQNSQTHHQEMAVPAVHLRTLLELAARVLAEDRLQFATAQASTSGSNGNGHSEFVFNRFGTVICRRRPAHWLRIRGGAICERFHTEFLALSLPRPQFDQASALMLARVPITQLRSLRLPEARWEHTHHRPRFRAVHQKAIGPPRHQTKAMDLEQALTPGAVADVRSVGSGSASPQPRGKP